MEKAFKEIGVDAVEMIAKRLSKDGKPLDPIAMQKVLGAAIGYYYEMSRQLSPDAYTKMHVLELAIKEHAHNTVTEHHFNMPRPLPPSKQALKKTSTL